MVAKWPILKDKTEVKFFLGLANYYRRFVKGFFKTPQTTTSKWLSTQSKVVDGVRGGHILLCLFHENTIKESKPLSLSQYNHP